jgi:LL-diaminopimelate aminotransferase
MQTADRLAQFPPYVFASLGRRITQMRGEGIDVIRLDIGSPDMPPAPFILDAMNEALAQEDMHGYGGYFGRPTLRQAMATYYRQRFDISLDPDTQILPLLGSKEGIFHLPLAVVNPGDVVLVPDPGYPTYSTGARLAGADPVTMPLLTENDYLPDLEQIPDSVVARAKLMWINYPNNPTSATADMAFLEDVVTFAQRNDILICHDAPYVDVSYDGYRAPSLLQASGAKEVAIEFNSLSKTYNMAGWRVGMAVGNAEAVEALGRFKSNIDSGLFPAIQAAAETALRGDQEWLVERNGIYEHRRDLILSGLKNMGLTARKPSATLYVWAKVPDGFTSAQFADRLLSECAVSLSPGSAFGSYGEGFVRISVGNATERIEEAVDRLVSWRR